MKILVFAAHPDDAETVVGGSICRYTDAGHDVHVINMTNNHTVRVGSAERASRIMGCSCEFLDFEDVGSVPESVGASRLGMRFDPEHLAVVQAKLAEHQPDLVWAHWPVDTHSDHQAAGSLVLRACDLHNLEHDDAAVRLWFFHPASGYQSLCEQPNHFEDITPYVERKRQAVAEYACVDIFNVYPLEETACAYYGYLAGVACAEGFTICRFRLGEARHRVVS